MCTWGVFPGCQVVAGSVVLLFLPLRGSCFSPSKATAFRVVSVSYDGRTLRIFMGICWAMNSEFDSQKSAQETLVCSQGRDARIPLCVFVRCRCVKAFRSARFHFLDQMPSLGWPIGQPVLLNNYGSVNWHTGRTWHIGYCSSTMI